MAIHESHHSIHIGSFANNGACSAEANLLWDLGRGMRVVIPCHFGVEHPPETEVASHQRLSPGSAAVIFGRLLALDLRLHARTSCLSAARPCADSYRLGSR